MNNKILGLWAMLVTISLTTRLSPLIVGHLLERKPWVKKIASQLPYMILILLLVHDAESRIVQRGAGIIPSAVGLSTVFLMHYWKRTTILSIGAGLAVYAAVAQIL